MLIEVLLKKRSFNLLGGLQFPFRHKCICLFVVHHVSRRSFAAVAWRRTTVCRSADRTKSSLWGDFVEDVDALLAVVTLLIVFVDSAAVEAGGSSGAATCWSCSACVLGDMISDGIELVSLCKGLESWIMRGNTKQLCANPLILLKDFISLFLYYCSIERGQLLRLWPESILCVRFYLDALHFRKKDLILPIDFCQFLYINGRIPLRVSSCLGLR